MTISTKFLITTSLIVVLGFASASPARAACVPISQSCDQNNICCNFPDVACRGGYCQPRTLVCGKATEPCCDLPNPPCADGLGCSGGYCPAAETCTDDCGNDTDCGAGKHCDKSCDPNGVVGNCVGGSPPPGPNTCTGNDIPTGLGCIPTDPTGLVEKILGIAIGVASGIAMLLLITGAFKVLTSSGDPKSVMEGKDTITSAIAGLLLILLSVAILNIIGVKILGIPIW